MRWDDEISPIAERGTPVTLDMLKIGIRKMLATSGLRGRRIGFFVRDSMTIEARMAEHVAETMIIDLSAHILAEKKDVYSEVSRLLVLEIETPASPWHHFRHNHRDAWWMRWLRRPIRYTTHRKTGEMHVDLTRYLTYPHADVPFPGLGAPVQVWQTTDRVVERGP